jgi:hypothetical protein
MKRTRDRLFRYSPQSDLGDRLSLSALDELLLEVDSPPSEEELAWNGVTFRLRLLEACGFGPDAALALAIRPEIGLERPLALIRGGCAPDTAARILI